jgi:hypothetical protein
MSLTSLVTRILASEFLPGMISANRMPIFYIPIAQYLNPPGFLKMYGFDAPDCSILHPVSLMLNLFKSTPRG